MMLLERLTDFCCDYCHLQFTQDFYPDLFCPYDHIVCQRCADSVQIDLRRTRVDTSFECPCCQTQIPKGVMNLDFVHRLKVMAETVIDMIRIKNNEIIELKRHVGGEGNRRLRDGRIKLAQYREPQEIINQQGYISKQEANNSRCQPFTFRKLPSIEEIPKVQSRVPLVESSLVMDEVWQMKRDIRMSSSDILKCQPDIQESKIKEDNYFSLKKAKQQVGQKQRSPFVVVEPLYKNEQQQKEGWFGMAVKMAQSQRERRLRDYEMNRMWALAQARRNLSLRSRASF